MSRLLPVLLFALTIAGTAVRGQGTGAAGSLLPLSPSPAQRVADRFLVSDRIPAEAEAVERRVQEALAGYAGREVPDVEIECRSNICKLTLAVDPSDSAMSELWDGKDSSLLQPWEKSARSDLALQAGFDAVTSLKFAFSEESQTLVMFLYRSDSLD